MIFSRNLSAPVETSRIGSIPQMSVSKEGLLHLAFLAGERAEDAEVSNFHCNIYHLLCSTLYLITYSFVSIYVPHKGEKKILSPLTYPVIDVFPAICEFSLNITGKNKLYL